jgi:citrate lyase beta subunit
MDERKFGKIPSIPAEAFILDLEDAVPPALKVEARAKVVEYLDRPEHFHGAVQVPRANALDTPWGRDDLLAFAAAGAKTVMYPMVGSRAELDEVDGILASAGCSPEFVVCIESMAGVLHAEEICAHQRVVAATFGPGDLHTDAQFPMRDPDGAMNKGLLWPMMQTIFAAKSQGVAVLTIVFPEDLKDLDDTRALLEIDKRLGFSGASSFYPPQVPVINEVFSPSPDEVAEAAEIVRVYEKARAAGNPAVQLANGKALLVHQYKDAQAVLAQVGGPP